MPVEVGAGFCALGYKNLARFPVARIEAYCHNKRADRFAYLMAAGGKVSHFFTGFFTFLGRPRLGGGGGLLRSRV